jgi:hypothetical protein
VCEYVTRPVEAFIWPNKQNVHGTTLLNVSKVVDHQVSIVSWSAIAWNAIVVAVVAPERPDAVRVFREL